MRQLLPPATDITAVRFVGSLAGMHLWNAAAGMFGPEEWFDTPGLRYVNEVASPFQWGIAFAVVGILLTIAIFVPRWPRLAKVGLALGMFLTLLQAILTGRTFFDDVPAAAVRGVAVWGCLAAIHYACLLSDRQLHR